MRFIITIVAAACLGVHALLGCCWSHLVLAGDSNEVAAGVHSDHGCESGCNHHHSGGEHQDKPNPCKCNCRSTCNFLPTVKVDCNQPDLIGFVAGLLQRDTSVDLAYFVESHDLARAGATAALPLRLHLWNQMLLI